LGVIVGQAKGQDKGRLGAGWGQDKGSRITKEQVTINNKKKIMWSVIDNWTGIESDDLADWTAAYPAVDVPLAIRQMTEWLKANPEKAHKSRWRRFLTNWLQRSQDRGGNKTADSNGQPGRWQSTQSARRQHNESVFSEFLERQDGNQRNSGEGSGTDGGNLATRTIGTDG